MLRDWLWRAIRFWLNIHPNCLHQIIRWTPMGRSEEEIRKIKEFSSFEKNPASRDPRTQKQVEAYRQKERDRARWLRDYRQWERYRDMLGDKVPKTFETFRRHKLAGDEKYQAWKNDYRKRKLPIYGRSSGSTKSSRHGEPVQIGHVDFSDRNTVLSQLDKAQKETKELPYEVNYTVTSDGAVWRVSGESSTVAVSDIPSDLAGSYSYHNHPAKETHFSFGPEDIAFFFRSGEVYSKASDHIFEYIMQRTPETLAVSPEMVYHEFKETYGHEVLELAFDGKIDMDDDGFHETMRRLSQKYRFLYERRRLDGSE